MRRRGRVVIGLRWIFALSMGTLLTVLTLATGRIIVERERGVLEEETERRLLAQCRNLASLSTSPLLDEFPEFVLHPLIKDILGENRELAYAVVVDREGKIRGAADLRSVDQPYAGRASLTELPVHLPRGGEEWFRHDEEILEVSVPALYRDGSDLGRVYLGMRKDHIQRAIDAALRSTIRVVLGALGAGLLVTLFLVTRIVRPINMLTRGAEEIGRGNLAYRIDVRSRTEVGRLARTFNEMAGRLKEAQKELVEKERLGRELEIAREIEEKLLPRPNLRLEGYDIAGFHESAETVGGDYYDLIPIDDAHVGLTVADVAGKGVPGLVVMAMTSALLRSHAARYPSPAEMLIRLNTMLRPSMRRGMFLTMFYGILHLPTGRLTYASAGHNTILHFHAGDGLREEPKPRGIPLGLFGDERFASRMENHVIDLAAGDGFLQYTDGVNEATNEALDEFGIERLRTVAAEHHARPAGEIVGGVVRAVRRFTGDRPKSDDITILALKRAEAAESGPAGPGGARKEYDQANR